MTERTKLYKEVAVPARDLAIFMQVLGARRACGELRISFESGSPRGQLVWRELVIDEEELRPLHFVVDTIPVGG